MARSTSLLMLLMLACSSFSGCLFGSDDDGDIELIVNYQTDFGTIIETYSQGELTEKTPVTIDFDFSNSTASNSLQTYGINPFDGREPITVDAASDSIVSIEFIHHGLYEISAFAIDSKGNRINETITIRVDLRIDWTETDTNNPLSIPFNPEPNNQGQHPKMIEIISNVENPALIGSIGDSGQSVQLTWQLVDELGDICQSRNGQINDGDTMMWQTLYFNTYMEHELRILMDEGQDSVNVNQSVSVLYDN